MSGDPSPDLLESVLAGGPLGTIGDIGDIAGGHAGPSSAGLTGGGTSTSFGSAFSVGHGSSATSSPVTSAASAIPWTMLILLAAGGLVVLAIRR